MYSVSMSNLAATGNSDFVRLFVSLTGEGLVSVSLHQAMIPKVLTSRDDFSCNVRSRWATQDI